MGLAGGGYTSFNDVAPAAAAAAAAAGPCMNDGDPSSNNNDNGGGRRSHGAPPRSSSTKEPRRKIPGIDQIGDLRVLSRALQLFFTGIGDCVFGRGKSGTTTTSGDDCTAADGSSSNGVVAWGAAVCRALLSAVQVGLALVLGLVGATFSGWYLGCIVVGLFVGKLVLGWDELLERGGVVPVVVVGEKRGRSCGTGGGEGEGEGKREREGKRDREGKRGDEGRRFKMLLEDEQRMFVPLLAARMGI